MEIGDFMGKWPDDTTLAQATEMIHLELEGLRAVNSIRRWHIRYGWHNPRNEVTTWLEPPENYTIGEWRNVEPPIRAFIAIDDGSGGLPARSRKPELV